MAGPIYSGHGWAPPTRPHRVDTPRAGSWMERANEPIPEHVKRHHTEVHAPWLLHSLRLPLKGRP